ncbi:MFS transporter [Nocardia sp. NPDC052566]|uniref:MFS transporter n=1 Tax=Nocardia sp. NPDC052566 TaxID=3364330 RepID=UPI0037CAACDC
MRFYQPFAPLFGAIFCCLLGVGATLGALPLYLRDDLGSTDIAIGVVVTAIAVSAVVARPIAGRLADRHGYKPVMLIGVAVCVVASLAYFSAAQGIAPLVAVRILHGIGEGTVYTAGATWLVFLAPLERRGRVIGLYGICMWLGITLGALIGVLLLQHVGVTAVWWFSGLAALVGLALAAVKRAPTKPDGNVRSGLLAGSALLPGIALSLAAFGYAALAAFVALHLAKRDISDGIFAFNAFGVTYVGVRLFIGGLPDKLGANRVALWSALTEAVGLVLVGVAPNLIVAVIGGLVMGAGLSLLFPALALVVLNRTDASQHGVALGAFTSFWDIGLAVGGPLAGLIAANADYPAIYYVMAVCAIASAGLAVVESRRRVAVRTP